MVFCYKTFISRKNVVSYGINDKDKMTSKTTVAPLTLMYQRTFWGHYRPVSLTLFLISRHYLCIMRGGRRVVLQFIWHFQKFNQKSPQRIESESDRVSPHQIDQNNDIRFYIKLLVLLIRPASLTTNWLAPMDWQF